MSDDVARSKRVDRLSEATTRHSDEASVSKVALKYAQNSSMARGEPFVLPSHAILSASRTAVCLPNMVSAFWTARADVSRRWRDTARPRQ